MASPASLDKARLGITSPRGAPLGIIEIFFGSPWPVSDRLAYAPFMAENGFEFYLYGPKADPWLRRRWSEPWPEDYVASLRKLSETYREYGIRFGVALSPFGLQEKLTSSARDDLRRKLDVLTGVGIDSLGIFFDDMPGAAGLAERQVQVLEILRAETAIPLTFCPSYYSTDPILDKVFGPRDPNYLADIGREVSPEIEILWTGPKVISDEIPAAHLAEVAGVLRRPPFICDNFFANDGPKNCKFIKLRDPGGRSPDALAQTSHWSFNPMNQPELSKLVLLGARNALARGVDALRAFPLALCEPEADAGNAPPVTAAFADWLLSHRPLLRDRGLDALESDERTRLSGDLATFTDPAARELIEWLRGAYTVGNECLTD